MAEELTGDLALAENALRDFIQEELRRTHGDSWLDKCGVQPERLEEWHRRREVELKTLAAGVTDDRELYFAELSDLATIVFSNWDEIFSKAFGDKGETRQRFQDLRRFRNPDAHRRSLLPFEVLLARGSAGFFRASIAKYRSGRQLPEDYFPRLEHFRDSLGNSWTPSESKYILATNSVLRAGETIELIASAYDPLDGPLQYQFSKSSRNPTTWERWTTGWSPERVVQIQVGPEDIGLRFAVDVLVRSERDYHAWGEHDDSLAVTYSVIPAISPNRQTT